jgi:regulation of enolase protein 1 (concanavalin A-like superfamily)
VHRGKQPSFLIAAALLIAGLAPAAHAVPPSAPWVVKNIGPRLTPGFVDVDPRGFWTIRASNGDIAGGGDSLLFAHQPLSGDGSILALMLGQQGGNAQWGKSGLMIRADDTPQAANVHFSMSSGRGLMLTYRASTREDTQFEGSDNIYGSRNFPIWLRLQRDGDRITPFISPDGFGWTQVHAPITLPGLPNNALVGLTAASLYASPVVAAYSNVTVVPSGNGPLVQYAIGSGSAMLRWQPVAGAVGYIVRRSALETPVFAADQVTPEPIKETSFSENGLANGRPLRYLVSAVYDQGGQMVEGWSTAVTLRPSPSPAGFISQDLSLIFTQLRGDIAFDPSNNTYRIEGFGGDFWDVEDQGYVASKLVSDDFTVTVRLLDRLRSSGGKAGLMIRESLDARARNAFLAGTQSDGILFQYREETGAPTALNGPPVVNDNDFRPPTYLRLVRKGSTITPFYSIDGTTYSQAGPAKTFDPPLAKDLYVGYGITSSSPTEFGASTFSDFAITAAP